ncbi:DUF7007 domain-containing protein [Pseudomonas aeruginosa]
MSEAFETPWGLALTVEELAPGIQKVTTESHGGYRLSHARRTEMLERMGFDHEWYEEDDEGLIVQGVFAAELGVENGEDLLSQVYPEVLAHLREQAPGKLQAFVIASDTALQGTADASVPARDRLAFKLAAMVTPEPDSAHNLEWLVQEAMAHAKFVRVEERAGAAIFIFRDRSILVALQSGMVYGVPTGSPENVEKLIVWLEGQGITERIRSTD